MSDQMANFEARLKRINDPRVHYYTDPETGLNIPKRLSKAAINASAKEKYAGFWGVIVSILIGAFCVAGVRYVRFSVLGLAETPQIADIVLLTDLLAGSVAALMFGGLIRHKSLRHMAAQSIGVMVMVASMHNLVWAFPDKFQALYSPEYVAHVQSATTPQTLIVRGGVFSL